MSKRYHDPVYEPLAASRDDQRAVEAFRNFLSWGAKPSRPDGSIYPRPVPPAWWAYAFGLTGWCPPKGEM